MWVRRTSKLALLVAVLVFGVATTIWYAAGDQPGDEVADPPVPTRFVHDRTLGIFLSIPPTWIFSEAESAGNGVSAGNGPVTWNEVDPCTPEERAHVDLSISPFPEVAGVEPHRPARRPARLSAESGTGLLRDALLPCHAHVQRIDFTSDGKSWSAYLRFGGEATQSDRQRAYSVIESMRPA